MKENLKHKINLINNWRNPYKLSDNEYVKSSDDQFKRNWLFEFNSFKSNHYKYLISNYMKFLNEYSINNMTLLDVGCNEGFHSIECLKLNMKFVTGVDVREDAIYRSNLMKEYYGLKNVKFIKSNIENLFADIKPHDITLVSGLLYHLSNPIETLEKISKLTNKFMLLGTFIYHDFHFLNYTFTKNSSLKLRFENIDLPGSGSKNLVTIPSQKSIIDMLSFAGFKKIYRYYPHPFFDKSKKLVNKTDWAFYLVSKEDYINNRFTELPDLKVKKHYNFILSKSQFVEIL